MPSESDTGALERQQAVRLGMDPLAYRLRHGFFETHDDLSAVLHEAADRIEELAALRAASGAEAMRARAAEECMRAAASYSNEIASYRANGARSAGAAGAIVSAVSARSAAVSLARQIYDLPLPAAPEARR